MNLVIVTVGKLREAYYRAAVQDYLTRIHRFLPVEQIEVASAGGEDSNGSRHATLAREAEAILRHLQRGGKIVALDRSGTTLNTEEFSEWLQRTMNASVPRVSFVVGGAWGLAPSLLEKADLRLSLSSLTFPHELARLVLVEQLYRALTLWKNLPYHK